MIVDPTMQSKQPNTPILCSFSFKIKWANTALTQVDKIKLITTLIPQKKVSAANSTGWITYLTMMLNAPSGVTSTAGANMYATKFAISPTITA